MKEMTNTETKQKTFMVEKVCLSPITFLCISSQKQKKEENFWMSHKL